MLLEEPIVFNAVLASLTDSDANVRAAALDLLRKSEDIDTNPRFRAELGHIKTIPTRGSG